MAAPLSPLTVPNGRTARLTVAPRKSDTATVSYSLNAAITRSSMPLHPDLLDEHLLLLSRLPILNPLVSSIRFFSLPPPLVSLARVEINWRRGWMETVVGNSAFVGVRNISGRVVAPRLKPRKPGNDQLNETSSALMHSLPACRHYLQVIRLAELPSNYTLGTDVCTPPLAPLSILTGRITTGRPATPRKPSSSFSSLSSQLPNSGIIFSSVGIRAPSYPALTLRRGTYINLRSPSFKKGGLFSISSRA